MPKRSVVDDDTLPGGETPSVSPTKVAKEEKISKKPKKAAAKAPEADADVAHGSADTEAASSPAKAAKAAKAKVVQADYMPSSYAKEAYEEAAHLSGAAHKIVSWNVNGINACMEKGFRDYVRAENADILVLQETKLQEKNVEKFDTILSELGYAHRYWSCSTAKKGYAGTALFSKVKPLRVSYGLGSAGAHNEEGRTVSAEFESFHLVNCYVPNSGQKLERLQWRHDVWDPAMLSHLQYMESGGSGSYDTSAAAAPKAKTASVASFFKPAAGSDSASASISASAGPGAKPVVFTGDLNVAHEDIDLKNFKTNKNKTAGFCDEEREGMSNFLGAGFDDTYRRLHPGGNAYTYYGMRFNGYAANNGWRIDYFITSEVLRPRIDKVLTRQEVYGASDHVPIGLILTK